MTSDNPPATAVELRDSGDVSATTDGSDDNSATDSLLLRAPAMMPGCIENKHFPATNSNGSHTVMTMMMPVMLMVLMVTMLSMINYTDDY